MYTFLPDEIGEKKLSPFDFAQGKSRLFLSLSQYVTILAIRQEAQAKSLMVPKQKANALWQMPIALKILRWLLRRGSPLPIPNRVVKPACADGTAIMWESMSSPFF